MTCYQKIICPNCGSDKIMKSGWNALGTQRYRCQNIECITKKFMLKYRYRAYEHGIKKQVVEMAINGSGIRDTARVLKINKNTVITTLKKKADIIARVNPNFHTINPDKNMGVRIESACEEAEIDEQWSFVKKKSNQRWLWYAVDHATNKIFAYVLGKRKDIVSKQLKALLDSFGIMGVINDNTDFMPLYALAGNPALHTVWYDKTNKTGQTCTCRQAWINLSNFLNTLTSANSCVQKFWQERCSRAGLGGYSSIGSGQNLSLICKNKASDFVSNKILGGAAISGSMIMRQI